MYKTNSRIGLAVISMMTIGTTYGWSATAAVLRLEGFTSDMLIYTCLVASIGAGAGLSSFIVLVGGVRLGSAIGLGLWAVALLSASFLSLLEGSIPLFLSIGIIGGFGTGIAYTALVGFSAQHSHDIKSSVVL